MSNLKITLNDWWIEGRNQRALGPDRNPAKAAVMRRRRSFFRAMILAVGTSALTACSPIIGLLNAVGRPFGDKDDSAGFMRSLNQSQRHEFEWRAAEVFGNHMRACTGIRDRIFSKSEAPDGGLSVQEYFWVIQPIDGPFAGKINGKPITMLIMTAKNVFAQTEPEGNVIPYMRETPVEQMTTRQHAHYRNVRFCLDKFSSHI